MVMRGDGAIPVMAFAAPESASDSSVEPTPVRVRSEFPETWIWVDEKANDNGEATYRATAPDTITSWVASAFAISEDTGLGVAPSTAKLRVFRPFFIRLDLPYSVKRGEKFALRVLVFNYLEQEQDVTVTLKHDDNSGFGFMNKDGSINKGVGKAGYNQRLVSVPGGGVSKAVYFPIVPNEIGMVQLMVTAQASLAGDAVEMPLRVEPEGYRVDRNVPVVVDLSNVSDWTKSVELVWPEDVVDGSKKARVDVIGDIMGPVLTNIDKLVRMPYGCGEQNMLNFVPNIVVLRYLKAINRGDAALEAKAKKYMEAGYQRELTYRRSDNSFSAFGESDKAGSTWLTAFVVRSFAQAKDFIFIDSEILSKSIAFLNAQQMETGAFAEHGEVHHKDMQGGASEGGIGLTAYVTIALLENGVRNEAALTFLEKNLKSIKNDSYALAVVTYALHLAENSKRQSALSDLEALQVTGSDGSIHWSAQKGEKPETDASQYFFQPRPVDVETTAYSLLSYMTLRDTEKGLPIVRWLTSQRNSEGGFSSTQDTVIALLALGSYGQVAYSPENNVTITVRNGANSNEFGVTSTNALVLQSYELPNVDSSVVLQGAGKGIVFAQVSYSYHRNHHVEDAPFFCTQDLKELRNGNRLQIDLCCNYTRGGQSNMAVAEVPTLTGYRYDVEESSSLSQVSGIKRTEFVNDDTQINLYFNGLDDKPICFSLNSDLLYNVADTKPAEIVLYDYYNPVEQLKTSYALKSGRSLTDSCSDCWMSAEALSSADIPTSKPPNSSSTPSDNQLL
ncbi:unnamed protein product [Auanema sp. JU1783]|nr:unnamed protein product [Auanema sp. JU1783]